MYNNVDDKIAGDGLGGTAYPLLSSPGEVLGCSLAKSCLASVIVLAYDGQGQNIFRLCKFMKNMYSSNLWYEMQAI